MMIEVEVLRALVAKWRDRMSAIRAAVEDGHWSTVEGYEPSGSEAYADAHGECAEQLEALLPPDFSGDVDKWRMLAGADEAQREKS